MTMQELEALFAGTRQMRLQAMPLTQRSASCLCTQLDTARRNGDLGWAYSRGSVQVIVEHRETSEGAVVPENVRSISVSVRHGADVKADQLDRDLEYLVSLCTDKTSYFFGSLKVGLEKEYIEKTTPVLPISGRLTLPIIVNIFGNETEFESLLCTDRPTSFECINRFNAAVSEDTWILSNIVEVNFRFHHGRMFGVSFFFGSKTDFPRTLPRTYPRMCGRLKQLISPIKNTSATITSSSSRTTTSSCLPLR